MKNNMKLKIITPKKVVLEETIVSITVPSTNGEMTILPRHVSIFALLEEGVVKYKTEKHQEYLAIGGGYIECDGESVKLLVSRAYGQDQIDLAATKQAIENAKKDMRQVKDEKQIQELSSTLRRSLVDMKLLKKKAPRNYSNTSTGMND